MTHTVEPFLLGLDVGSTNAKAILFGSDGVSAVATRPMPLRRGPGGSASFDPDQVWNVVSDGIREVIELAGAGTIASVGVTSMAESGVLIDAVTGSHRTPLIPWFDTAAGIDAQRLAAMADPRQRFCRTGQSMNYKAGVAKITSTIRQRGASVVEKSKWLSTADYVAYRLAGALATDPSLAARTHAFDITKGGWDELWIRQISLEPDLFPEVLPSGTLCGRVSRVAAADCGLAAGVPVAVAGHDHVVAAYALGILKPGRVLDSMGTAESMTGAMPQRDLTEADCRSGLLFGPHVVPGTLHWMGALSAAGGSVEWLRTMLADPYVSYEHLLNLLSRAPDGPSPILYFPYLAGAQAPEPDASARGAFFGLKMSHTASDLALAVLQGATYEMERIRRSAAAIAGPLDDIVVTGGGTRIRRWLQLKADVAGVPLAISPHREAAALGAALLAGVGAGVFAGHEEAQAAANRGSGERVQTVQPDPVDHRLHQRLLDGPYAGLQAALRAASRGLAAALREEDEDL